MCKFEKCTGDPCIMETPEVIRGIVDSLRDRAGETQNAFEHYQKWLTQAHCGKVDEIMGKVRREIAPPAKSTWQVDELGT